MRKSAPDAGRDDVLDAVVVEDVEHSAVLVVAGLEQEQSQVVAVPQWDFEQRWEVAGKRRLFVVVEVDVPNHVDVPGAPADGMVAHKPLVGVAAGDDVLEHALVVLN